MTFIAFLLTALFSFFYRPQRGMVFPIWLLVTGVACFGIAGFCLTQIDAINRIWLIRPDEAAEGLRVHLFLSASLAVAYASLQMGTRDFDRFRYSGSWEDSIRPLVEFLIKQERQLAVIIILWLLASGTGRGWENLFWAEQYHQIGNKLLLALVSPFGICLAAIAAVVFGATRKWYFLLLAILCWMIYLVDASRGLVFVAMSICVGVAIGVSFRGKNPAIYLAAAVIAFVWLLPQPIQLRRLETHGLGSYLSHLVSWDATFQLNGYFEGFANLFSGFSTTIMAMNHSRDLPLEYFFTEVSPLPSVMNDWQTVAGNLNVRAGVPYSGVASLRLYGVSASAVYCVFVAGSFRLIDCLSSTMPRRLYVAVQYGTSVCMVLALGFLLQYTLRTSTRVLYYSLFAVFVTFLFRQFVVVPLVRERSKETSKRYTLAESTFNSV